MPAIINPVTAITPSGQSANTAPELVLTPGTVIDARVLAVREGLVRIAIAGLALDALSEVALQPGTNLRLAVSQTGDGIRLAIVPSDPAAAKANAPASANAQALAAGASDVATSASLQKAASPPIANATAAPALSAEAMAVARAVQAAAPRQTSLTPLFANLPVIVASPAVPKNVQQAASQLLAARTPLAEGLNAADLRQAFQKSGLFLEASLASGAMPSGTPDLKAALVVFRQVVSNWLGQAATAQTPAATPVGAAASTPEAGLADPLIPSAARRSGEGAADPAALLRNAATQTGDAILKGDVVRQSPGALAGVPARAGAEPPPPFRGALPSPQPIASPSLVPDLAVANAGRQLLDQTEAALSRQTLLQVASLPDRPDQAGGTQNQQPRWSFEIPFATPQGTAVAQFEISRDGGGNEQAAEEGSSRVWRARFTLDVEPAGPVHALVSLVGDKTAVKIWAERPDTAERLRAGTQMLGHALRQADLVPGDILVGQGRPVQAAKAPAGHFLDRAT